MITDFFNSYYGKIIISVIWGLGLSALFRKACVGRCIILKAPPKNIENKTFKFNKNCYKFKSYTTKC